MRILYFVLAMSLCLLLSENARADSSPAVVVTLAKQAGISEQQAKQQLDQVVAAIRSEVVDGREVTIKNFGKFYVQQRDARVGRNPKTGAAIQIPAKRYPRFASADKFKADMNPVVAANPVPAGDKQEMAG